jgi:hypothetical protein
MTVSLWSTANPAAAATSNTAAIPAQTGILLSTGMADPSTTTTDIRQAPILYIGTDGRLYAQFPTGQITPIVSPNPVTDGQWHTATLTTDSNNGNDQVLYLDGGIPLHIRTAGRAPIISVGSPANTYAGAGTFNADAWLNAPRTRGTVKSSFFAGQMSDIGYAASPLSGGQLTNRNTPVALSTTFGHGANVTCIEDYNGNTTAATKVELSTCVTGNTHQQWTLQPNGTITYGTANCMTVHPGGTADGTLIELQPCGGTNTAAQQWQMQANGSIANPATGKCIDAGNGGGGAQLQIYTCNNTSVQQWTSPLYAAPAARNGTIVSGQGSPGLCLDDRAGGTTNGTPVQVYTCNTGVNQTWDINAYGNITIHNLCVDDQGGGQATGLVLQTCNGNANQQWEPYTGRALRNPNTGLCIDGGANTISTQVRLWTCNAGTDQMWTTP